ncbi:zinc transporter [Pseudooceanicola sp. LIPI14-2-Ac024]|uniref:zinc transporter n=1 Tax=Pseudooceanicola sp. LIPI14-2-Ac024 TaxID=3344875 RepID=UPI0035CED6A1
MTLVLVVLAVSAALIVGALWGLYGRLPAPLEGFLIALAGGALIVSVMEELIRPALDTLDFALLAACVAAGALAFTVADRWLQHSTEGNEGAGLLLAITFDGVPENLALGVALIGTSAPEVAALAGSILLSNLPEAAGGAKEMAEGGMARGKVLLLWSLTAALLAAAAILGNLALRDAGPAWLAAIRCLAAGAVTASLATEVFPKAFREDRFGTGIAIAAGLLTALALSQLSSG